MASNPSEVASADSTGNCLHLNVDDQQSATPSSSRWNMFCSGGRFALPTNRISRMDVQWLNYPQFQKRCRKFRAMEDSKGCLLGFAAAFAYTVHNVMMKLLSAAGEKGVPVFEQHTTFCSFLLLSAHLFCRVRGIDSAGHRNVRLLLVLRGLLFAVSSVLGIYALKQLPLGTSRVLSMTSPIFTTLFAYFFLGECLDALRTFAIAGSFCGVVLVLSPSPQQQLEWLAVLFALLGAAIAALAFVTTKRLAEESAAVLLQYMGGAGAIVAAVASLLFESAVLPSVIQASFIIGICVAGLVAQIAFIEGLQMAKAGLVSGLQYTQVVFSYAAALIIFGENFTISGLSGTMIIVCCACIIAIGKIPVCTHSFMNRVLSISGDNGRHFEFVDEEGCEDSNQHACVNGHAVAPHDLCARIGEVHTKGQLKCPSPILEAVIDYHTDTATPAIHAMLPLGADECLLIQA